MAEPGREGRAAHRSRSPQHVPRDTQTSDRALLDVLQAEKLENIGWRHVLTHHMKQKLKVCNWVTKHVTYAQGKASDSPFRCELFLTSTLAPRDKKPLRCWSDPFRTKQEALDDVCLKFLVELLATEPSQVLLAGSVFKSGEQSLVAILSAAGEAASARMQQQKELQKALEWRRLLKRVRRQEEQNPCVGKSVAELRAQMQQRDVELATAWLQRCQGDVASGATPSSPAPFHGGQAFGTPMQPPMSATPLLPVFGTQPPLLASQAASTVQSSMGFAIASQDHWHGSATAAEQWK
eukprot:TRINITY_DN40992_c0_g1_i1.p1 TRINITY_DN40992_c0_g1~~TRINITY_DN40992_c0_g1_i1.p1  ORF type:complete len:294 (+),score=59.06 TRINITY_DN40992_c0_g1_i1:135-1016(+)